MTKIPLVSIIDDDKVFQFFTKRSLESSLLVDTIIQFPDGEKALEYFLENKEVVEKTPDLVFLDINMPYLDGWQFLDKFTANMFSKKIITIYICSSSTSIADMARVHDYPKLKGYLIKPILKSQLTEVLLTELSAA